MRENQVIVFVKYPIAGFVKTRLARGIGKSRALTIYKKLVTFLIARIGNSRDYGINIFYTPRGYKEESKSWLGKQFSYYLQNKGDLGERMLRGAERMKDKGAKKIILLGADAPEIDHSLLVKAFEKLGTYDIVIGPTYDGGYYLLGFKKMYQPLFKDIAWSSEKVYGQTIATIRKMNLTFYTLPQRHDIDTKNDLQHLPFAVN